MSSLSRQHYLMVARAVRDSGAAYESKAKIVASLGEAFSSDSPTTFGRHAEVFAAVALSATQVGE